MTYPSELTASSNRWPRRVLDISAAVVWIAGIYALVGGLVTIAGWVFDEPRLTDWGNDGISMFVNAALCASFSGLCLLLIAAPAPPWRLKAARALASAVAILGGLTLIEHLFVGVNLGIDTLLIDRPWGQHAAAAPMRMGPPASLSFLRLRRLRSLHSH
jgi:hypothetical protein